MGAGVVDVDPPFAWNCQVVAGAGVVENVQQLYHDMHSYLAGPDCTLLRAESILWCLLS